LQQLRLRLLGGIAGIRPFSRSANSSETCFSTLPCQAGGGLRRSMARRFWVRSTLSTGALILALPLPLPLEDGEELEYQ